jgi:hypothetical protein
MKTENFAIIANGKHEYDITVTKTDESTSYEMRYSNGDQWTEWTKAEHILSATDHGNGIKFTEKIKRSMDYDNFTELRLLMQFINNYESNISQEYTTYKQIN